MNKLIDLSSYTMDQYGAELKKSTVNQLESKIQAATDKIANNEFGNYKILDNQLNLEKNTKVKEAQDSGTSMSVITSIYQARITGL